MLRVRPYLESRLAYDIDALSPFLDPVEIRRHYLLPLMGNLKGTMAEVFVAARFATQVRDMVAHVPGRAEKNFDILVFFDDDSPVAVEVKHQRDSSPFEGRKILTDDGTTIWESVRPSVDPRFLDVLPPAGVTHTLPSSTRWRDAVSEALEQLPACLPSIVALSVGGGDACDDDIEDALFGDPVVSERPRPRASIRAGARLGNGVFNQPQYSHLAAVWAFRLVPYPPSYGGTPTTLCCNFAKLHVNPHAQFELPARLPFALPNVFEYIDLDLIDGTQ